jgi:hypothetical protein
MHTLFRWLRALRNLDFRGKFDMAFSFESHIELSLIFGRGMRGDFPERSLAFDLIRTAALHEYAYTFLRALDSCFAELKVNEETAP